MKINKKLLMAALAGAIVVGGGVNTYAEGAPAPAPKEEQTNDAPGKTDQQKIDEARAKAKKQLADAGVPFEKQGEVLKLPNSVYDIEKKTNEILAEKEKADKELAKTDLGKAKLAAKAELKKKGLQVDYYNDKIDSAQDLHSLEQIKADLIKQIEDRFLTLDEYNKKEAKAKEEADKKPLADAKANALDELKKAGLGSDKNEYVKGVNEATTVYDVEKAKEAGLKWAKENLTSIEDWNKKEEEADKKAKEEAAKKPVEDARAEALAELKKAGLGIESNEYVKRVKDATTVYDVEKAKEAGLEWAKENLTSIDDWNEKEAAKTRRLTIDEWLKLQK
ncbi:peptoalbumin-binding protein, partial [Finegoldia magna ACS-171-V-Col3]|uniref:albumin-binding GA domain-containing protein n=1 Tax=Finegoldia magna TaxID=1260 RepID=UPI0001DE59BB